MVNNLNYNKLKQKYRDIKRRCYNPKCHNYKWYGGRGITMCDEWKNSFKNFFKWAIENGFDYRKNRKEQSLDRIDNNGNYEPSNCRFATMSMQNINMRHKLSKTGYIGVYMHSSKTTYTGSLKVNGKKIFTGNSKSKNECARLRNEYILKNNLYNKLNVIKEELEETIL